MIITWYYNRERFIYLKLVIINNMAVKRDILKSMITPKFLQYLAVLCYNLEEGKLRQPIRYKDLIYICSSVMTYRIITYLTSKGIMTKKEKEYFIDVDKLEAEINYLIDAYKRGEI
jgi:hypothetical protein